MGWFRLRDDDSRPAAVSVLGKADGMPVGSGVLLPGAHLLTCAHVVNAALDKADLLAPGDPGPVSLRIRVHGPDDTVEFTVECAAELSAWIPPEPGAGGLGGYEWNGGLAVLRLSRPLPPAIRPPRWHPMAERQLVRAWHGGADRGSYADAEVTECNGRFGYVDGLRDKLPVGQGYSGGPLWSRDEAAVVGLVTAKLDIEDPLHRAWGIPWQRVRRELDRAGMAHLAAQPDDGSPATRPMPTSWPCWTGRCCARRSGRAAGGRWPGSAAWPRGTTGPRRPTNSPGCC
jgi:Trypsin-like peptidase domain